MSDGAARSAGERLYLRWYYLFEESVPADFSALPEIEKNRWQGLAELVGVERGRDAPKLPPVVEDVLAAARLEAALLDRKASRAHPAVRKRGDTAGIN